METKDLLEELKNKIERLERENRNLLDEMNYAKESPYLQSSILHLHYEVVINRDEVMSKEFGHRINEKHGTMYEIKTQSRRLAQLLGLDADGIRMMVTEAVQNIIEHGYGKFVHVSLDVHNNAVNPYMVCSFKHELPPGEVYTLSDINRNALKGDVTSEHFDFESSRGRGEFIMKELTDERRIINGIEINPDGQKIRYFKRILIKYSNPQGPHEKVTFSELKREIDRLDIDDVVCYFHVHHLSEEPTAVTIATLRSSARRVSEIMKENGFQPVDEENYYRTVFATYRPVADAAMDKEKLLGLFAKVRQIVHQELDDRAAS
ncbi:ATP-binding protein [Leptonema illini]|jgi:anti-sigma regulatory factor (Ser/Thr protein kinase)|uniref:ATP-binding region ATPase domain protein n=1 Tax=Leptonema illini DSM 21528 TaxID=929563 RepID=H2CLG8_9LEPT|nr:ATP-binding region ATPase domain protein [Leptonema illini]EHQ04579.1 ATP-binding region ATPase domain protein [Leptonema illini DSM 21528]PKL33476.1 MAG: ATP-binding protein [Spirochaetae bacterium HGW-Spirochaetae-10]